MRINYDNNSECFIGTSRNSEKREWLDENQLDGNNGASLSECFIGTNLNSERRQ